MKKSSPRTDYGSPNTLVADIAKKSLLCLLPLSALSCYYGWKMPAGVLAGGVIALVNLRAIANSTASFLGAKNANRKLRFLGALRFAALFMVFSILFKRHVVNPFGLLAGLTVVFIFILVEGVKIARSSKAVGGDEGQDEKTVGGDHDIISP
ncbi:MAG: ATP synthase subunit I [Nitrospiraceae bacterium]|nr:ATP synthase subunit I [Nitrospiraceae bacterium]